MTEVVQKPGTGELERETTSVLQRLVRFNTVNPPGNERPALEYLASYVSAAGFETELLGAEEERPNLVATLPGAADGPTLGWVRRRGHRATPPARVYGIGGSGTGASQHVPPPFPCAPEPLPHRKRFGATLVGVIAWWDARPVTAVAGREIRATGGLENRSWLISHVGSGFPDTRQIPRVAWLNFHVCKGVGTVSAG